MYQEFIRNRITELRLKRGLSERELSLFLGKNPGYINNITSGKSLPTMDSFLDICDFFDITPLQFFQTNLDDYVLSEEIINELKKLSNNDLNKVLTIIKSIDIKLVEQIDIFLFKLCKRK